MRSENLPDGSNDKVTWKRSGDLLTKRRNNVTLRRDGDVPQRCYWVFYLGVTDDVVETYQWDVKDTYHWDVLVTYHWDVVECFIWDLFETSWGRTDGTSLLRPLKTSSGRFIWDIPATSLGRPERRRYDVLLPSEISHAFPLASLKFIK